MKRHFLRMLPVALLDVGTSKAACWIVRGKSEANIEILGAHHQASQGYRCGQIVDLESLSNCLATVVERAEHASKERVRYAIVCLPARMLTTFTDVAEISLLGNFVSEEDINRLQSTIQARVDKKNLRVVHVIPQTYSLDGQAGIENPRSMTGKRLGGRFFVVCAQKELIQNLLVSVHKIHLEPLALVAAPYMASFACLNEDERRLGTVLLDMGGSGITLMGYRSGVPAFINYVPQGGYHITRDLAYGLECSMVEAERMKILQGSCVRGKSMAVGALGQMGQELPVSSERLFDIIYPRVEEMLQNVKLVLQEQGCSRIWPQRFVLTGGASQLAGIKSLLQGLTQRYVRLADIDNDQKINKMHPSFSVLRGLVLFMQEQDRRFLPGLWLPSFEASSYVAKITSWFRENL